MESLEKLLGKGYINKLRIIFLLISIVILIINLYVYRPYIYKLNISDYSIANSLPSLIYEVILIQLSYIYCSINKVKFNSTFQILSIATGLIIAEIIQSCTYIGTFDLIDIIYILIGIPLAIFIEKIFIKV